MTISEDKIISGFARSIKEGKITIEQVPEQYREKVQSELQ